MLLDVLIDRRLTAHERQVVELIHQVDGRSGKW
jgi:hypothetical protein